MSGPPLADGSVVVHGGDGIEAQFGDLAAAADQLRGIAGGLADAAQVHGAVSLFALQCPDPLAAAALADAAARVAPVATRLRALEDELRRTCRQLDRAVASYRSVDAFTDSPFDRIGAAITDEVGSFAVEAWIGVIHLPAAALRAGDRLAHGDPVGAGQALLTADPELADIASDIVGAALFTTGIGFLPDGRAVLTDRGVDRRAAAARPPRSLADVIAELGLRDRGPHGAIDVRILTGPDGRRRAIVDITGTKSWSLAPVNHDVTSLATNARAIVGLPTAYEHGVLTAMARAGVRPQDPVMIVGHSLGGMVAVAAARDAVRSGRFTVTHVITAGSPIGMTVGGLPPSVRVLALENRSDVVPHADGRANPDRRNVVTVTTDIEPAGEPGVGGEHGIDTAYLPAAREAQAAADPAIGAFLADADGYFEATEVRTRSFVVTRSFR